MNSKTLITIAGISGALAVILGAAGAHSLRGEISDQLLDSYKTGNAYHMYHSLAILILPAIKKRIGDKNTTIIGSLWIAGILLFSGSIYLLSVSELLGMPGLSKLGPVTPVGGILIILGWLFCATSALTKKTVQNHDRH